MYASGEMISFSSLSIASSLSASLLEGRNCDLITLKLSINGWMNGLIFAFSSPGRNPIS